MVDAVNQLQNDLFLLTPLREGRLKGGSPGNAQRLFLLTPLREGRREVGMLVRFYIVISTHAPAGGATCRKLHKADDSIYFYSRPCGRGDQALAERKHEAGNFYSRPCGRGDSSAAGSLQRSWRFLLTPLREGRRATYGCA